MLSKRRNVGPEEDLALRLVSILFHLPSLNLITNVLHELFVGNVDGHHLDFNTYLVQPAAGEQAISAALDRGDPEWDSEPGWTQAASGWLIL